MPRFFLVRHHRLIYFLPLYGVYVAVLFGIAGAHDPEHAPRSLVRLASPMVELGLASLLCAACMRMALRGSRPGWLLVSGAIAATAAVVYLAQTYSLFLSHNFISVLAMQNADSVGFVGSPLLQAGMVLAVLWIALFCTASWLASTAPAVAQGAVAQGAAVRWGAARFGVTLFAVALLFTYLMFIQGSGIRLEPGFRQSPVANLAVNVYRLQFAAPPTAPVVAGGDCFDYPHDSETSRYPFLHARARQSPLPLPRAPGAADRPPNIIVIFAEGLSARLIGAYGGRYPGLTPNIDALAAHSMQVNDYFNHTAATFRGLEGQLSSNYSYAGGGGKEGWVKAENRSGLVDIRRRTVPQMVNAAGYDSIFFAPHKQDRALILMLESLGFSKVHTYESIGQQLLDDQFAARPGTAALDDKSLFRGVVEFLKHRAAAGNEQPFFLATYNIGTHAFLESSKNGIAYRARRGNSVLDKVHTFDSALGEFLRYFRASPYADNTLLVFTSDHATYPEPAMRELAGSDLKPYFVDRIPLLVSDPFHRLPNTFDTKGRNSLVLAPTLLQLAGIASGDNAFLGASLFEPRTLPVGVSALASQYYLTTPGGVFGMDEIPPEYQTPFRCSVNVVRRFYAAERNNRIVPPAGGADTRHGSTAGATGH